MKARTIPAPLVLAVIGLGAFITALDQTVVVTALPGMMLDLKIPVAELDRASWIVTAYLLGYTSIMPLMGRLADVYGHARVYQAALVVFGIGTSLVAISPNLEWIVGARVVQAIGGGATVPIGMAIASTVPPSPATRTRHSHRSGGSGGGLHAGPGLWWRHHRAFQLAVDFLAQRAPGCPLVRGTTMAVEPSPAGRAD